MSGEVPVGPRVKPLMSGLDQEPLVLSAEEEGGR